jgi:hypothetical protein
VRWPLSEDKEDILKTTDNGFAGKHVLKAQSDPEEAAKKAARTAPVKYGTKAVEPSAEAKEKVSQAQKPDLQSLRFRYEGGGSYFLRRYF